MGRLRKKFAGNTAEASSEPLPSERGTPKALKPKPKISRNSLNKETPQTREIKKKNKSVLGSRKPSVNSEKEDDDGQSAIQKCTTGGQHNKMNHDNGAGLEKKMSQMNEENHDQLGSQQGEEKKEKIGIIEKKQQFAKNRAKWFKPIEDVQMNDEKHGQFESQQIEKQKEKLDGLQKKQHFDKKKEKWFKRSEHGQMNEEQHGQLQSQLNEKQKEKLDDMQKKQHFDKKKEKVSGLICMCSAKTKSDCFHYSLMGLPIGNKELVLGIKPGLKLFLYDFDLKLLYGIYTASSNGGLKLEPAAFGGGFPAQVRFSVYQDCYPLPESVFRRAIKENYYEKNRFNTELTDVQVEKLTELFRPAEVHLHEPPLGPTPMPALQDSNVTNLRSYDEGRRYNGQHLMYGHVPSTEREDIFPNQFPSEKEYRTYGLRGERPNFTPPGSQIAPQLATRHDPYVASENQTYGLFPRQELRSPNPLAATTSASVVDPYSMDAYTHPHGGSYLDPYSRREEVTLLGFHSLSGRGESYMTETTHLGRTENVDSAKLYSTYASNALSEYNQITQHQVVGPESSLAPVSARYSFAGPSLSRR